jgi:hypothetical protein
LKCHCDGRPHLRLSFHAVAKLCLDTPSKRPQNTLAHSRAPCPHAQGQENCGKDFAFYLGCGFVVHIKVTLSAADFILPGRSAPYSQCLSHDNLSAADKCKAASSDEKGTLGRETTRTGIYLLCINLHLCRFGDDWYRLEQLNH